MESCGEERGEETGGGREEGWERLRRAAGGVGWVAGGGTGRTYTREQGCLAAALRARTLPHPPPHVLAQGQRPREGSHTGQELLLNVACRCVFYDKKGMQGRSVEATKAVFPGVQVRATAGDAQPGAARDAPAAAVCSEMWCARS